MFFIHDVNFEEIIFENIILLDESYQFSILNEGISKKKVTFSRIKISNILITNAPYVFFIYETDFFFIDSKIYNAYPICIYGIFSNLTITNNSFSNVLQRNETYQVSALYIEYSSNLLILKNNFTNLISLSNAPVKFLLKNFTLKS